MNPFSKRNRRHRPGERRVSRVPLQLLGAASLFLVLGACARSGGPEDVKPTATTAFHSSQPGVVQGPARQP